MSELPKINDIVTKIVSKEDTSSFDSDFLLQLKRSVDSVTAIYTFNQFRRLERLMEVIDWGESIIYNPERLASLQSNFEEVNKILYNAQNQLSEILKFLGDLSVRLAPVQGADQFRSYISQAFINVNSVSNRTLNINQPSILDRDSREKIRLLASKFIDLIKSEKKQEENLNEYGNQEPKTGSD
jgi:hypothetical protein